MKDSLGVRRWIWSRTWRSIRRSRTRRSSASASSRCRGCGSATTTRSSSRTSSSTGWSTASIPTAGRRRARRTRWPTLTRDDLIAFHQKWFGANNAILAIVGDVTPDEAFAGAERAFGGWARRRPREAIEAGRSAARRRAASSSSTSRAPSRPRSASATSRFRARTTTSWRSTSRRRSSAAKAPTGCTACCAPSAA